MGSLCSSSVDDVCTPIKINTAHQIKVKSKQLSKTDIKQMELLKKFNNAKAKYGEYYALKIYDRFHEIECGDIKCINNGTKRHVHINDEIVLLEDTEIYCSKCSQFITTMKEKKERNNMTLSFCSEITFYAHCELCCITYATNSCTTRYYRNSTINYIHNEEILSFCNICHCKL
jgi:hypothetical protein